MTRKPGLEIWLVHSTNFTARVIQLGMKVYCILRGKKIPSIVYNHALIYDKSQDCIYEADFPEVVKLSYEDWLSKTKNKKAKLKKIPLNTTDNKYLVMVKYLEKQVGKPYETINFWWHMVKIFTGHWFGSLTDDQHYCYELVIRAMNTVCNNAIYEFLNPYEFDEYIKSVKSNK